MDMVVGYIEAIVGCFLIPNIVFSCRFDELGIPDFEENRMPCKHQQNLVSVNAVDFFFVEISSVFFFNYLF